MSEVGIGASRSRKADPLIRGARKVFMERGFEGASVDEIARVAGASKATLSSYFPDKRQLCEAVMGPAASGRPASRLGAGEPVEAALHRIARSPYAFVLSPGALEMFRAGIAEAARFPDLGRAFHTVGPGRVRSELVAFLAAAVAEGEIDDTCLSADQFAALCKARLFLCVLFGGDEPSSLEEIETSRAKPSPPSSPATARRGERRFSSLAARCSLAQNVRRERPLDLPSLLYSLLSTGAGLIPTNSATEFSKGAGKAAFDALKARLAGDHGVQSLALLDGAKDNPAYAAAIRSDLAKTGIAADPDVRDLMRRLETAIAALPAPAVAPYAVEIANIKAGRDLLFRDVEGVKAGRLVAARDMTFSGIKAPPGKS